MESEKIKEIKKALQYNVLDEFMNRLPYGDEFNKLKMVSFEDILTYINELESGYAKGYADGIKNTYEVVMPEKLKDFVKRLKEKMPVHYPTALRALDETLKEFINDNT